MPIKEDQVKHKGQDRSAAEKVIKYIKDKIIQKEWFSGDKLPTEPELCVLTGVSRSGVREAVKVLQANNIVEIKRGNGTYISQPDQISFSDPMLFKILLSNLSFEEIAQFRESIEAQLLMLAVSSATLEDIDQLQKNISQMEQAAEKEPENYKLHYELDIEFHHLLAQVAHNSILKEIYLSTFGLFQPLLQKNYLSQMVHASSIIQIHTNLLKAISDHDCLQVGYAVKESINMWMKSECGDHWMANLS